MKTVTMYVNTQGAKELLTGAHASYVLGKEYSEGDIPVELTLPDGDRRFIIDESDLLESLTDVLQGANVNPYLVFEDIVDMSEEYIEDEESQLLIGDAYDERNSALRALDQVKASLQTYKILFYIAALTVFCLIVYIGKMS